MPCDVALALLFVTLIEAVGGSYQQPAVADAYQRLVTAYRQRGRPAIVELETWTTERVDAAVSSALGADESRWTWQDRRAAAALHTDVWYVCLSTTKCRSDAVAHLGAAERLLESVVRAEPRQTYYAERWYATMGSLLNYFARNAWADELAQHARARFTHSPARKRALSAYARGLQLEHHASVNGRLPTAASASIGTMPETFKLNAWSGAASQYEEALEADPDFLPATLHLGRVRLVQGNTAGAAQLFKRATNADDPRISCLAHLFLGSISEGEGRFVEAAQSYLDAFHIYPSSQAAAFALAQVLSRSGRETESHRTLAAFLSSGPGRAVEPLWTYLVPPQPDLAALAAALDELHVEALR